MQRGWSKSQTYDAHFLRRRPTGSSSLSVLRSEVWQDRPHLLLRLSKQSVGNV